MGMERNAVSERQVKQLMKQARHLGLSPVKDATGKVEFRKGGKAITTGEMSKEEKCLAKQIVKTVDKLEREQAFNAILDAANSLSDADYAAIVGPGYCSVCD